MRTAPEPLLDGLLPDGLDTERLPVRSRHRAARPGARRCLWVPAALALVLAVGGLAVLVAPAVRGPVDGAAPALPSAVGTTDPVARPASPDLSDPSVPSSSPVAPSSPAPVTVAPEPVAEVPVAVPSTAPSPIPPAAAPSPPVPEPAPTCDERPGRGHGRGHGDREPRCP
ncbi:hypothetical protein [Geodermatophilus normandii]|uniref:Uncharacterized protein n=1 Tax=Geodermatophilus normandii TaxID=1137989 RepID=A0A6P0GBX6_9ACTN|nr:hypothetical protein [Geodermatophilus normandii]NEM05510.1 hypothetical protein [Geodermatophilus normandii]